MHRVDYLHQTEIFLRCSLGNHILSSSHTLGLVHCPSCSEAWRSASAKICSLSHKGVGGNPTLRKETSTHSYQPYGSSYQIKLHGQNNLENYGIWNRVRAKAEIRLVSVRLSKFGEFVHTVSHPKFVWLRAGSTGLFAGK